MDEIMDTKVVQMKFDNSQFRAGVQDTIKQLEQLDNSLELQGASTGLDKVSKASKDTANSLTAVSDATQEVQRHFSALEIVGITVMMRLTNAALTYGSRMANNLWSKTFGQIISGGKARSQNIANAKFQLEGLGVAWKEIGEDINYGVKDTAYGLDEAAKAAAQMVASMDLANGYTEQQSAQMRIALRAISGVAAMTNSSYSEIADVFTTVSSNGKLMTMQLRQLAARGLNASAVLAKAMNKTEEEINNMVTQGKISFREFAEAMDDAFGAHAKEANKTFQGALSNVRAALSRIGAKFAEPVYENLRKIFNGLIPLINNINKSLDPVVEAFTSIVNTGGDFLSKFLDLTDLARFFGQTILNIYGYIRPVIIAFFEVFAQYLPYVERGSRSMGDFAKQFALSGEQATKVRDVFRSVFGVIDLFIHVAISALKILMTIGKGLVTVFKSLTGSMEPPLDILYNINTGLQRLLNIAVNFIQARLEKTFEAIGNALKLVNWEKVLYVVGNIAVALAIVWQLLLKLVELVIYGFKKLIPMIQVAAVLLGGFVTSAIQGFMVVAGLISNIFGRGKDLVTNIIVRTQGMSNTAGIFNAGEAVQQMDESTGSLNDSLDEATSEIDELNDRLEATDKNARRAGKSVDDLRDSTDRLVKAGRDDRVRSDRTGTVTPDFISDINEEIEKSNKPYSLFDKRRKRYSRDMGFFETLASYFVSDKLTAIHIAAREIDDFFKSIYMYLIDTFSSVKEKIEGFFEKHGGLKGVIWKIIWYGGLIEAVANLSRIFRAIIGALDIPAAIGSFIRRSGLSMMFAQLAKVIQAASIPIVAILGLVAIVSASAYLVDDIDKLNAVFESILNFVKEISKWTLAIAGAFGIISLLIAIGNKWLAVSDAILALEGKTRKSLVVGRVADILKSFGILLAGIAAAVYLFAQFDPNDQRFQFALVVVGTMTVVIAALATLIAIFGYKTANSANKISVTRRGLVASFGVFSNSMQGITLGLTALFATIAGSIALLAMIPEERIDMFRWAAKFVGQIMGMILIFVGVITVYTRLLITKTSIAESAAVQAAGMAQAVKNVGKVITALGFALIEVAAALWIVSKTEYPSDDRILKIFGIISGIIGFIAVVLPVILARMGTDPGKNFAIIAAGLASMTVSMGLMFLALAGMFKILETINNFDQMPLKTIIAITSIIAGLVVIVSAIGTFASATSTALDDFFGATMAILALTGMLYALGGMFKVIGESISEDQITALTPLLISVISVLSGLIAVIAVLGAIPATMGGTVAVLISLTALFAVLGASFYAIGKSVSMFANINWFWATESAKSMDDFVSLVNKAVRKIKFTTMIGLSMFSIVCKQISKGINYLNGIDTEDAMKAADAFSVFIKKVAEIEEDLETATDMSKSFAAFAWMLALGMAGITAAVVGLDATVILIAAFVLAIELYGSRIGPALKLFIDQILMGFKELNDNADEFESGILRFLAFAGTVFLAGIALSAGSALFLLAAIGMAYAGSILAESFESFVNAFISIVTYISANNEILALGAILITAFGVAAMIAGASLAGAGLLFLLSATFFAAGVVIIGEGLYETGLYLNAALDEFNKFLDGIEDLKNRIEESINDTALSGGATGFGQAIWNKLDEWGVPFTEEGYDWATDVADGYIDGTNENHDRVVAAASGMAEDTMASIEETAETHSPSKRTYRVGEWVVQGLIDGIDANKNAAINCGISLANGVLEGLETIDSQIRTKGEMHAQAYKEGFDSIRSGGRIRPGGKNADPGVGRQGNAYADQLREENEEMAESFDQSEAAAEGAAATTQTYASGMENGLNNTGNVVTNALNKVRSLFGIDMSGEGKSTISTWFSSLLSNLGINAEGIKDKVFSLGTILGTLFGDGIGKAVEQACRAIAQMTATNLSDTQQQAIDMAIAAGAPGSVISEMRRSMAESNRITTEHGLMATWRDTFGGMLNSLPNIDDILDFSVPGGSGYTPSTTSDMAAAIAGSSGAGSGINDQSKAASIGGGVGNTITNSNNTYNFYQNNYSPEPLNRSAIYQQTRQQLNGFYTYVKEKNLSY